MRRPLALLLIASLVLVQEACRPQPHGAVRVEVIGGDPQLRDPALGPLPPSDAVLLENVAQGLVSFDASGNIVPGLAERWNVSEDGLSYIFRIASAQWPDGRKITAEQVARIIKRQLGQRSRNEYKDAVGAIDDVIAMTDRVIEIQLLAPRPNLLSILAQPEFAILHGAEGTGPFKGIPTGGPGGEIRLTREIITAEDEQARHEEVLLSGKPASDAVADFVGGRTDLVLGGTFADLPVTRRTRLASGSLRFDPASGLFGLVPLHGSGQLGSVEVRKLLSAAIDRANFVGGLGVPGLAPRATLLEPGLDGIPAVTAPDWFTTPLAERLSALRAQSDKLLGKTKPVIRISLPTGAGADFLFDELKRDWSALGLDVERAPDLAHADFLLLDEVAPSSSPAWFARHFRCMVVPVCDAEADQLMDAARNMPVPAQRYALIAEAATRIDDAQLFIPITAPVRWSLVSQRIQNFAGNRYARHSLSDLEQETANN